MRLMLLLALLMAATDTAAAQTTMRLIPAPADVAAPPASDVSSLIAGAARDLAEYERLTSEGKLGEAGQRLEALKQKLDQLQRQPR